MDSSWLCQTWLRKNATANGPLGGLLNLPSREPSCGTPHQAGWLDEASEGGMRPSICMSSSTLSPGQVLGVVHLAILPAAAKERCAALGWARLGFRLRGAAGKASHSQAQR